MNKSNFVSYESPKYISSSAPQKINPSCNKATTSFKSCHNFTKPLDSDAVSFTSNKNSEPKQSLISTTYEKIKNLFNKDSLNEPDKHYLIKNGGMCFEYNSKDSTKPSIPNAPITYEYIEEGSSYPLIQFKDEVGATPLPIEEVEPSTKLLYIDNGMHPYGTIAIAGKLDETIATGGLWQCAGVAVVDKKHDCQTLIHVCPGEEEEFNKKIIDYVLNSSNPDDLEISIVPGSYEDTDKTIKFIMDVLEDYKERENKDSLNVNFRNYADDQHTEIKLHNGVMSCYDRANLSRDMINPEDRIIYAKRIWNGFPDWVKT